MDPNEVVDLVISAFVRGTNEGARAAFDALDALEVAQDDPHAYSEGEGEAYSPEPDLDAMRESFVPYSDTEPEYEKAYRTWTEPAQTCSCSDCNCSPQVVTLSSMSGLDSKDGGLAEADAIYLEALGAKVENLEKLLSKLFELFDIEVVSD